MKSYYRKLYTKNREFLEARPKLKGTVLLVNAYLPYLFALAYLCVWLYALVGNEISARELAKLFYLPATALLTVSVLQIAVEKPRPYQKTGAGITPLQEKKSRNNSLPSRHLTSGSVIAVCLFPHSVLAGAILLGCCLLLGYCRFAVGWHYPSDLLVGFAIGAAIGCCTFLL